MRLSEIIADEKELEIEIGDDVLTITYAPSAYTAELEDEFMAAMETKRTASALAHYIAGLVVKWDLVDEEGPIPLEKDVLRRLPGKFLDTVVGAIAEDINPKKRKGAISRGGSLQRD